MPHFRDSDTKVDRETERYRNWAEYDDTERANDPFVELIQKDPLVCDNCFLKRYHSITCEWWRQSFGWSDFEYWIPISDRSKPVPKDQPSEGTRLACANCGHRNTKYRPIPKEDIDEYTTNISMTLDAKEIQHDQALLFDRVVELNTSENQGRQDTHVFSPAVEAAIRSRR